MGWFFIALIGPAIWAMVNLIDDNMINKVYKTPFFGTIISGLFALIPLLSLFFIDIVIPPVKIILLATVAGFLMVCSYFFYFKTLMSESPSITIALWNMSIAIVPFLAFFFLGEKLRLIQYIGFAVVLLSSMALSAVNIKKFKLSKGFYLMAISSFIIAIVAIFEKYVYQKVDFWSGFIFLSLGMSLGGLFFMICFKEGRCFIQHFKSRFKKYIWIFMLSEMLNIIAVFASNFAVSKGPVSLVKVIEGVQSMYVLIFAILLYPLFPKYFREATHSHRLRKIFLMMVILLGLYLINI